MTLALTIEARDPLTNGHCERLAATLPVQLGRALGLADDGAQAPAGAAGPRPRRVRSGAGPRERHDAGGAADGARPVRESMASAVNQTVIALGGVDERIVLTARESGGTGVRRQCRGRSRIHVAIRLVPQRVALLHELVPVAVDDKTIRFVTATPFDVDAERDVSFATGRSSLGRDAGLPVPRCGAALTLFSSCGQCCQRSMSCRGCAGSGSRRRGPGLVSLFKSPSPRHRDSVTFVSYSLLCPHGGGTCQRFCFSILRRRWVARADPGCGCARKRPQRSRTILSAAVINRFKVLARVGTAVRNRPAGGRVHVSNYRPACRRANSRPCRRRLARKVGTTGR